MTAKLDSQEERTRSALERSDKTARNRILAYWDGGAAECELPERGEIVVGRSRDCHLSVDHPTVSREHARLQVGDDVVLIDCGSSNGTRVGGARVEPGGAVCVLPGQLVELGDAVLAIQWKAQESANDAAPELDELISLVAETDISVVIVGETGVGKERAAEQIHQRSRRRNRPMLRLNCAALVESLLESELFGHERGAFTGAHAPKTGLLEAADRSTLFLDEVAELAPQTQAKLLRVLESGEVTRVGSVTPRKVDVRFVAATNVNLDALVSRGAFRRDLYFRLAGMTLEIPPLRERRQQIAELAQAFVRDFCERSGREAPALTRGALTLLSAYHWPGNIRELRNVAERAVVMSRGGPIEPSHLGLGSAPPGEGEAQRGEIVPRSVVRDLERRRIVEALEATGGNQTQAAQQLGISRRTLINRLDELGLPRPRKDRS